MLSAALSEELKNLCVENGFHRRRNAYFRVIGDGVFQVIKFEYEPRSFCPYHLQIGLFSNVRSAHGTVVYAGRMYSKVFCCIADW